MAQIKGWIGNKADAPTAIEITDPLAHEFMRSPYYSPDSMLRRMVPVWLASSDGKNIAWDNTDEDLDAIDDLIVRIRNIEQAG